MKHQLIISDLTVAYRRIPAVHHLDLVLKCGHCVGLLGPNGAGKTSLFKALVGLVPLVTGSVSFGEHGRTPAAAEIAYLPQRSAVDWDFPVTVRGLVEMGRYLQLGWWRPFAEKDARAVEEALSTIGLGDLADRQISALSGGQQQRVFIARSLRRTLMYSSSTSPSPVWTSFRRSYLARRFAAWPMRVILLSPLITN